MRHFLSMTVPEVVAVLAGGVTPASHSTRLIAGPGGPQARPAGKLGAAAGTVAVAPIAEAAKEENLPAGGSSADDKP